MWPKIDVHTHHSVSGQYHFHKDAQEDHKQEVTKESNQRQNAKDVFEIKIVGLDRKATKPYI